MEFWWLLLLPLMGGLIGWLTNRIAIQMLFYPRRPLMVFGRRWQGLIPRRQAEIAVKVAELVEREIFHQHLLREQIRQLPIGEGLNRFAEKLIRERLAPRLREIPLLGRLVGDGLIIRMEEAAKKTLAEETPPLLEEWVEVLEKNLNVHDRIRESVLAFDPVKLEKIVRDLAHKEFRRIEWLGGFLGFVIGIVQAAITLFFIRY